MLVTKDKKLSLNIGDFIYEQKYYDKKQGFVKKQLVKKKIIDIDLKTNCFAYMATKGIKMWHNIDNYWEFMEAKIEI